MSKKPSCMKAVKETADLIASLESNSHFRRIVDEALDTLKENIYAGLLIEKNSSPKSTSRNTASKPLQV